MSAEQDTIAVAGISHPEVTGFYDMVTSSIQYVLADPATGRCAVVDPILDFDPKSGSTATRSADRLLDHIGKHGLRLDWILDTHPHADHLSAAGYLRDATGAKTAIGGVITEVQTLWKRLYNLPDTFRTDGSQWDHLFADGEHFSIGEMDVAVMHSPGHTLCSITYIAGDAAFIHDTLFMPDTGTARADFPGGNASRLWQSIQAILALPDDMRLFTGHDYREGGREARWQSTVAEQKAANVHVLGMDEAGFVALRTTRDRSLPMPELILPALQVNIAGGRLPAPERNGQRYLKTPLNAFSDSPWH